MSIPSNYFHFMYLFFSIEETQRYFTENTLELFTNPEKYNMDCCIEVSNLKLDNNTHWFLYFESFFYRSHYDLQRNLLTILTESFNEKRFYKKCTCDTPLIKKLCIKTTLHNLYSKIKRIKYNSSNVSQYIRMGSCNYCGWLLNCIPKTLNQESILTSGILYFEFIRKLIYHQLNTYGDFLQSNYCHAIKQTLIKMANKNKTFI